MQHNPENKLKKIIREALDSRCVGIITEYNNALADEIANDVTESIMLKFFITPKDRHSSSTKRHKNTGI